MTKAKWPYARSSPAKLSQLSKAHGQLPRAHLAAAPTFYARAANFPWLTANVPGRVWLFFKIELGFSLIELGFSSIELSFFKLILAAVHKLRAGFV